MMSLSPPVGFLSLVDLNEAGVGRMVKGGIREHAQREVDHGYFSNR